MPYKKKMIRKSAKDCAKMSQAAAIIQRAFRARASAKKSRNFGPAKKESVAKALTQVAERKLQPLTSQYERVPTAQAILPTTGPVYFQNYVLGQAPSTWLHGTNPGFTDLGGYTFPQGTGSVQRIGRFMYLEHCSMTLVISRNAITRDGRPLKFRVIVYKHKRNDRLGSVGNPCSDLFLSNQGAEIGVNTSFDNTGSPGNASLTLMNAITNKKTYEIFNDDTFILQPQFMQPSGGAVQIGASQTYPCEKIYNLKLKHNKKASFDQASKPEDVNYQYAVTVLSCPIGTMSTEVINGWSTSVRGTVSALDS